MSQEIKLTTVLIADDHEIFRDGLKLILHARNGIELIGEADNGRSLIALARQLRPEIIITDIKMPEMDGVEATRVLTTENPKANIISLSMFDEEDLVVEMFEAGAKGYLLKNAHKNEILEAIATVKTGQPYFCTATSGRLTHKLARSLFNPYAQSEKISFTDREMSVIRLICDELTNKEIADRLFISSRTVEGVRQRIIDKMKVKNTAGMVIYAVKTGLYKPAE
jgi:DNA-binding NarL/FixJ family response regulator